MTPIKFVSIMAIPWALVIGGPLVAQHKSAPTTVPVLSAYPAGPWYGLLYLERSAPGWPMAVQIGPFDEHDTCWDRGQGLVNDWKRQGGSRASFINCYGSKTVWR
jgi:hypothetical protein